MIHADMHLDNVLKDGERLNVIDFDDAGYGWHAFDLAVGIYHLLLNPTLRTHFELVRSSVAGVSFLPVAIAFGGRPGFFLRGVLAFCTICLLPETTVMPSGTRFMAQGFNEFYTIAILVILAITLL